MAVEIFIYWVSFSHAIGYFIYKSHAATTLLTNDFYVGNTHMQLYSILV